MRLGIRLPAIAICCLLLSAPCADAQVLDKRKADVTTFSEKISFEIYGGYLTGQSREVVYEPSTGHKTSELFWKIDSAFVVGGAVAVRPLEWLTLKVNGWVPVASKNTMDDYDWLVAGQPDWSDWSNHPDTKMNRAYVVDAGIAARVLKFERTSWFDAAQMDLLAGYRWFYVNWTASGGTYVQSSNPGFRDISGSMPDGMPVIGYEQWIETPYVGLGGSIRIARWLFSGELIGSLWGRASDRDDHYLRKLVFEESLNSMPMIAGTFNAGYALTDQLSLTGSFLFQKYFEVRGPTTITDYLIGSVSYYPGDAAGIDHYSMLVLLGLKWVF